MVHSHQRQLAASELQVDVPQIPHPISHIQDPASWPATYAAAIADAARGGGGGADGGGTGGGTKGPPKPVAQNDASSHPLARILLAPGGPFHRLAPALSHVKSGHKNTGAASTCGRARTLLKRGKMQCRRTFVEAK